MMHNAKDVTSASSVNLSRCFKLESLVDTLSPANNAAVAKIPELAIPVLGTFTGIFAKLDSMSVNKRFYSEKFWRAVLSSERVKAALINGTMIGIFEHPNVTNNFDEESGLPTARHPQNGAFVVKRLWIEGKNVMGEAYLLNTPLGKLLGTYFLARDKYDKPLIQLYMSARGYSKEDYFDQNGIDQMNENDYFLQSFDVVMNPGIKGTKIKMESAGDPEIHDQLAKLESMSMRVNDHLAQYVEIASSLRKELNLKSV